MGKRTEAFKKFIADQTDDKVDEQYEYSDSATIKNRFKTLLFGSKLRLKSAFRNFVRTKKGTCWELAISYDYYLLKQNKKNHHIVATKTGTLTCHTFNLYVDESGETPTLHIIDLFERFNDHEIKSLEKFKEILNKMYERDYNKWYVLSEVKNNFIENFKRLGMKRWSKFCGKTEKDGGFMVIDEEKGIFKVNNRKKVKKKFTPFKFPAWG